MLYCGFTVLTILNTVTMVKISRSKESVHKQDGCKKTFVRKNLLQIRQINLLQVYLSFLIKLIFLYSNNYPQWQKLLNY